MTKIIDLTEITYVDKDAFIYFSKDVLGINDIIIGQNKDTSVETWFNVSIIYPLLPYLKTGYTMYNLTNYIK